MWVDTAGNQLIKSLPAAEFFKIAYQLLSCDKSLTEDSQTNSYQYRYNRVEF